MKTLKIKNQNDNSLERKVASSALVSIPKYEHGERRFSQAVGKGFSNRENNQIDLKKPSLPLRPIAGSGCSGSSIGGKDDY